MRHPLRVLLVFANLCAGPEEVDLRRLAERADPERLRFTVVACAETEEAGAAGRAWATLGVPVDTTAYHLSLEDTIDHLAGLAPAHDVLVSCQDPPDVPPALAQLAVPPPCLTHAELVGSGRTRPTDATGVALWTDRLEKAAARRRGMTAPSALASAWMGGFESSTHRRGHDRRRVDVIAATGHDRLAASDYAQLAEFGMLAVRDGLRWHLVEAEPGRFDFSSVAAQVEAARSTGTQVVWDLLHYGWPDDADIWSAAFPARFARYAGAVAAHLAARLPGPRWYAPVNEISFLAWAGGDVAYLNPFGLRRGTELKVQLVRAALAARASILTADPGARFLQPEPLIHVVPKAGHPSETGASEGARRSQYEAWDMLSGRAWPQLGGCPQALDVLGVNYYPHNQWEHGGTVLAPGDPRRRPLADLLCGVHTRYGRPVVVSETGTEAAARVPWLELVAAEVAEARRRGVPVWAICLYPVLDHPGWDDDRYCPNGLLVWHPDDARRDVHPDVAAALRAAQRAAEIQEGITS